MLAPDGPSPELVRCWRGVMAWRAGGVAVFQPVGRWSFTIPCRMRAGLGRTARALPRAPGQRLKNCSASCRGNSIRTESTVAAWVPSPLPNRSSWRHILKKVDPGHIGSFRSGCRRRPRCCAPTARRVVGGSLETHRVTPRVRGGSRRRRRHRGAGQSRRRARIVLSLLHAAGGALRMLVRECRPAAQRPLQCRRGSVRPRRAPHRGTLGTWRRGTRLAAL